MSRKVFILWMLIIGVMVSLIIGFNLKQQNRNLTQTNSTLVLQNDSIISANLQCKKEIKKLQATLDSIQQNPPIEKSQVSSKPF